MRTQRGKPLHVRRSKEASKNLNFPKNAVVVAIGARVKDARIALQERTGFPVSQAMIAEALNVKAQTIGRIEAGIREADTVTMIALAAALRTAPCYLMFGCDHEMTPAKAPPFVANRSGMHLLSGTAKRRTRSKQH